MLPSPLNAQSCVTSGSAHVRGRPACFSLSGSQTRFCANTGLTMCSRASLSARPGL